MMFVRALPIALLTLGMLLGSAGRWDLPWFFVYTALMWVSAGIIYICLGSGLALGSWWSVLALVPILPVFVRRTLLEDRMLQAELVG